MPPTLNFQDEKIGPLSSCISDGATHFRKGMGVILSKDIPNEIRSVYNGCKLFNKVGGSKGATNQCDPEHVGKRSRAKIKSKGGIKIVNITFTKTDLFRYMGLLNILSNAEDARRLFDPEDNMDVAEMVKCLDAVGKLSEMDILHFPNDWQNDVAKKAIFREMRLLGHVARLMCTLIIGHEGSALEDGEHLSVSEYLTRCSCLSHLLFFLFRENKTKFWQHRTTETGRTLLRTCSYPFPLERCMESRCSSGFSTQIIVLSNCLES